MISKSKGFTLVELLIVIVILGILSSVMFVGITSAIRAARVASCEQKVKNIGNLLLQYRTKNQDRLPAGTGKDFYLQLVKSGVIDGFDAKDVKDWTTADLMDLSKFTANIFQCPFEPTRAVSYRGPKVNIAGSGVKLDTGILGDDLTETDANLAYHGAVETDGCTILAKGGQFKTVKKEAATQAAWDAYMNNTETIK